MSSDERANEHRPSRVEVDMLIAALALGMIGADKPDLALWMEGSIDEASARGVEVVLPSLSVLHPVAIHLGEKGELRHDLGVPAARVVEKARALGVKVVPTVQNLGASGFDPERVRQQLRDPIRRAQHVVNLKRLLQKEGYQGLNVDYESLGEADAASFSAFVLELGLALRRTKLSLSVCVPAITAGGPTWDGARFVDLKALAKTEAELVIMAYDHAWPGGPAGPVAPLGWVEAVAQHNLRFFPPARLRFGLPLYGYDWAPPGPTAVVPQREMDALAKARGFTWAPVESAAGASVVARYRDAAGVEHEAHVDPPAATLEKAKALSKRGIRRLALWRAGYARAEVIRSLSQK